MALPLAGAALAGLLRAVTVGYVARTMVSLGVTVVTFTGVLTFINYAQTQVDAAYGQLPATLLTLFDILQVPYAFSVIFAALAFRVTLGASVRWIKPPSGG